MEADAPNCLLEAPIIIQVKTGKQEAVVRDRLGEACGHLFQDSVSRGCA